MPSSKSVIPKEMLTAFQRWEMTSFGGDEPTLKPAPPQAEKQSLAPAPAVPMPSREEIAQIHDNARHAGYAEGLAQGLAEGRQEGFQAGLAEGRAAAAEEAARLHALAENFSGALGRTDEVMAQDLMVLALDIAKAMLKTALPAKPELVLPVVREAIGFLPATQQSTTLILHPEDAALVMAYMGAELSQASWRIREDPLMERGGCTIETPSNEINAANATRWHRIASALGREGDWLES